MGNKINKKKISKRQYKKIKIQRMANCRRVAAARNIIQADESDQVESLSKNLSSTLSTSNFEKIPTSMVYKKNTLDKSPIKPLEKVEVLREDPICDEHFAPERASTSTYRMIKLNQELIKAVKQYPQIYMNGCDIETPAWNDISNAVNCKRVSCVSKWLSIHYNYAKIKNLIHNYEKLENVLQAHPNTKIYLDGSLNFLDPYINKLPDSSLPKHIHRRYNWVQKYIKVNKIENSLMNSTLVTQRMIQTLLTERTDEKYFDTADITCLMEAVENAVTQCIITFKNNKENNMNVEDIKIISTADMSLEKESEDITDQFDTDINNYENNNIMYNRLHLDTVDNHIEYFSRTSDDHVHSDDIVTDTIMTHSDDTDVKEEIPNSDIYITDISEIKSEDNNTTTEQTDIKLFFNDLAEFVSNRLSLEKQKELRKQVSLLVGELLENND